MAIVTALIAAGITEVLSATIPLATGEVNTVILRSASADAQATIQAEADGGNWVNIGHLNQQYNHRQVAGPINFRVVRPAQAVAAAIARVTD